MGERAFRPHGSICPLLWAVSGIYLGEPNEGEVKGGTVFVGGKQFAISERENINESRHA